MRLILDLLSLVAAFPIGTRSKIPSKLLKFPILLERLCWCCRIVDRQKPWYLDSIEDFSPKPSHRITALNNEELPALHDQARWIGGFENIADYLRDYSGGQWDLDSDLSPQQAADSTAFSTFLHTHLSPLLLLSLYVSSTNYPLTRTAYTPLLPAPTQYLIPPRLRATAKERTAHLNLSSLDLDLDNPASDPNKTAQIIPPSLRKPNPSVTAALNRGEAAARFKLSALTQAALSPLQQLLGSKQYLLTSSPADHPTRLDCLLLGYLALALIPPLPQSWLADTLSAHHAPLCAYVRASLSAIGALDVRLEDALLAPPDPETETGTKSTEDVPRSSTSTSASLPWQRPRARPFASAAAIVLEHARAALPFRAMSAVRPPASSSSARRTGAPASPYPHTQPLSPPRPLPPTTLLPHVLSLGAAALAVGAYVA
ncbi:MAG: mitochondrial import receptor subunit [Lasallia pustulata]|uniref:Mitochondrial import receptor subunit n=1 Tax=Lasallia pustulata TaxID=136370 RepID=A0A5M8PP35_9LECA|nr:MAG: mitochondrial import receptor subunit [Lasallia pustulata]